MPAPTFGYPQRILSKRFEVDSKPIYQSEALIADLRNQLANEYSQNLPIGQSLQRPLV